VTMTRAILIPAVIAAVAIGISWGLHHTKGGLEIEQAPIWTKLQSIEATHRDARTLATPTLLRIAIDNSDHDVIGLKSDSERFPYVWIVLTADAGGNGIYAMPHDVSYSVTCAYVANLKGKVQVDPIVLQALESRCNGGPR
jgi:hypothetical protein